MSSGPSVGIRLLLKRVTRWKQYFGWWKSNVYIQKRRSLCQWWKGILMVRLVGQSHRSNWIKGPFSSPNPLLLQSKARSTVHFFTSTPRFSWNDWSGHCTQLRKVVDKQIETVLGFLRTYQGDRGVMNPNVGNLVSVPLYWVVYSEIYGTTYYPDSRSWRRSRSAKRTLSINRRYTNQTWKNEVKDVYVLTQSRKES